MDIAKTIIHQIRCLDPMALPAWGAKEVTRLPLGVQFKSSGMTRWKGIVSITLDEGKDLYILKFFRLRKGVIVVDKLIEDVFVEDLVTFINDQVG